MDRFPQPRVAVVLSSYEGLPHRCAPDARIEERDLEAMLLTAIELAGPPAPRGGWVIVKPNIVCCPGLSPQYGPAGVTDLRIVRSLIRYLAARRCTRITIAEGAGGWRPAPVDGWTTEWGGEFGGLTYTGIARELGAEILDLNFAETVEHRSAGRVFALPRAIRDCDALISLSPLKTNKGAGVSLAMKNLFGIAPGAVYGFPKFGLHALGPVPDLIADLFAFRPDTYGIVGGPWGVEGEADTPVHHNVLIAGSDSVAVDAVAASVMGFGPGELDFLRIAQRRTLGVTDLDSILVRGNPITQARRAFRRSAQWELACQ
jgi:uncharacterized protein (DUF362 family)